jgi:hypothetical protein
MASIRYCLQKDGDSFGGFRSDLAEHFRCQHRSPDCFEGDGHSQAIRDLRTRVTIPEKSDQSWNSSLAEAPKSVAGAPSLADTGEFII